MLPGRSFVSRIYATAAKIKELDNFTRLSKDFHSDLYWWHTFLMSWNGHSFLKWHSQTMLPEAVIVTDASVSWGCGTFWNRYWIQWQWPPEWLSLKIMVKDLAPIVMGCAVWGPRLSKRNALFPCDNSSVALSINKGSARYVRCNYAFSLQHVGF